MPDNIADDPTEAAEVRDTPGNQPKTEPMPPSPAATVPDFADPSPARKPEVDDAPALVPEPPVPSPGFLNDEHGHVAVSTMAAQGTSEQQHAAEGARTTALAQPGKPDGEVAT